MKVDSRKHVGKIIHVTESMGGGVIRVLEQLVEVQNREGLETTITYLERQDTPPISELQKLFPGSNLNCVGKSGILGFWNLFSYLVLSNFEDEVLIHFHSSWAGFIGRISSYNPRIKKTFYSPHGYSFLRTDVGRIPKFAFKSIEGLLSKYSSTVTIAYGSAEYAIAKKIGDKQVRFAKHYSEFQNEMRQEPEVKRDSSHLRILTIGRISAAKRPDRFAYLAGKFAGQHLWIWVGEGERKRFKFEGSGITVTGWLGRLEVGQQMAKGDLFLLLSDWEGLPFSAIDALSFGLPIILWEFPGAVDLVDDGVNGFICKSLSEVEQRVLEITRDFDLRQRLGRASQSKGEKEFSRAAFESGWRSLYE